MNGYFVDLHSHVLHGMDDGSKSVEESLQMLSASAAQGIRYIAATSHFYPGENSPERYLERRARAIGELSRAMTSVYPRLLPGAEVYYFDGISRNRQIEDLQIENTGLLLIEMPFSPWTDRMVEEVLQINGRRGIQVLMAHVERYLHFARSEHWDVLLEEGVLMQSNAGFFLDWKTKRKAMKMLKQGRIHFIASDTHNMQNRPPRIGEAMKAIGEEGRGILEENLLRYLPDMHEQEAI